MHAYVQLIDTSESDCVNLVGFENPDMVGIVKVLAGKPITVPNLQAFFDMFDLSFLVTNIIK